MALDATAGGAAANSYSTIAEAATYHETHLYPQTWLDTAVETQELALQMATRLLDQWFDWTGTIAGQTQALLWPRIGAYGRNGYLLSSTTIPTDLKRATAEFARQLLDADRTADSDTETEGLQSITVGSLSMAFKGDTSGKPIPDAVMSLIGQLGRLRWRSGGAVTMTRG